MNNEPRLMKVRIDGVIKRRYVDYVEVNGKKGFMREVPELAEGEQLMWSIADSVPTIVRGPIRREVSDG